MKLAPILIFLILQGYSYAQNFFPCSTENKYQFERLYYTGITDTSYTSKIMSDTVTINRHKYYKYGDFFYYYDQQNQKLYTLDNGDEWLSADFMLPANSSAMMMFEGRFRFFKSRGLFTKIIFGESRTVYKMTYDTSITGPTSIINHLAYEFIDGIGLAYYYDYTWRQDFSGGTQWWEDTQTLDAAIVNGTNYNQYNLSVWTTTPLVDRGIGDFPFYLQTGLEIRSRKLISEFYTEVLQFRSGELRHQYSFPVNRNSLKCLINCTELDTGDILKIRVVVSDNSIFNLTDSAPDTGYYVIKVLPDSISDIKDVLSFTDYNLDQNFPNPFNPSTNILYQVPEPSAVSFKVLNILGELVEATEIADVERGKHTFIWDGTNYNSGIYFLRISSHSLSSSRVYCKTIKMLLIK